LLVLIIPRVFGFSLIPPGVPILSASPTATISVTLESRTEQNTFILTASPQTRGPNASTRVIPDRIVRGTFMGNRVVPTSGTKSLAGAQASGRVLFDNSSHTAVYVTQGIIFTTGSGVQITVTQSVNVPARHGGQDGTVSASAVAVEPGTAGDIQANALNTNCCNGQVTVRNPGPFTGGVDPQQVHVVAQADLDGVRDALSPQLQQQALQQLQGQLAAGEVKAGQPVYTTNVVPDIPVGTQADQVKVQVSVLATALVYNVEMAHQVAEQLLSKQAAQVLDQNYRLKGAPSFTDPIGVQQARDDVIYLSVPVRGLWIYNITDQQMSKWLQSIKGSTPTSASTYLTSQPGIVSVRIQLPFGTDHLPISADQIQIAFVSK